MYGSFSGAPEAFRTGFSHVLSCAHHACRGVDGHKLPPNETDQVQPIDRGLGRQVKIYLGQQLDEWLDDDDNLDKWTSNQLTASDRRILLACWYDKAVKKALEGEAKWKYFQHSGALLTADGSDDDLIKFEGVPEGYKVNVPCV